MQQARRARTIRAAVTCRQTRTRCSGRAWVFVELLLTDPLGTRSLLLVSVVELQAQSECGEGEARALADRGWPPEAARRVARAPGQHGRVLGGHRAAAGQREGLGVADRRPGSAACLDTGSKHKNGKPHSVPLNGQALAVLRKQMGKRAATVAKSTPKLGPRPSSGPRSKTPSGTTFVTPSRPGTDRPEPRPASCSGLAAGRPGRWSNAAPKWPAKPCKAQQTDRATSWVRSGCATKTNGLSDEA